MKRYGYIFSGFYFYFSLRISLLLFVFFGTVSILPVLATHNRAGEITYKYISGNKYEITVTTYTKTSSTAADRCTIDINYGDGSADETIERINGLDCDNASSPSYCSACDCPHCGEVIPSNTDIKKNIYKVEHIFPGPGIYTLYVDDQNRNKDVVNIPNSINTSFYIESKLYLSPFGGVNSSPILDFPPVDIACASILFEHNPGAHDPDGDSLVFSLVPNRGAGGAQIPNYSYPNNVPNCAGSTLTINPITGLLTWNSPVCCVSPPTEEEFNIAILIEEYRNGNKIGSILRDMQIEVDCDCENDPPFIIAPGQLCVFAGEIIDTPIVAIDSGYSNIFFNNLVTLTASGEPLSLPNSPATFTQPISGDSIVSSVFKWNTNCSHLKSNPYIMTFRAEDNDPVVKLVDYHSLEIKIIAPPIENPTATPVANNIVLSWDPASCPPLGYKIYRRIDSSGFVTGTCQTGLPLGTGYSLIADCGTAVSNSYIDNNNGSGLIHGQKYCYVVVACYSGATENMVSEEFCAELKKDIPIITNVSVFETDNNSGKDSIMWAMPKELDTNQYKGPYQYKIFRSDGFNSASTLIGTTAPDSFLTLTDTFYIDASLNSEQKPYTYKIELFSNGSSVGYTTNASSVFLSSTAGDNSLGLSWQEQVPWANKQYFIYKKNSGGSFEHLATVSNSSYTDQGLVNGEEYCYYVQSLGTYSSPGIIDTILNNSQIHCSRPFDNVPPCSPDTLVVQGDCNLYENTLTWSQPDLTCADDVTGYNIFYSPLSGGAMQFIQKINFGSDTVFLNSNLVSIAGCYAVSAFDTNLNESTLSDTICVDNCPVYELPDIFTPGGDGKNDLFRPLPYKFVARINIQIFNRWGQLVYESTDPDIAWNGRHMKTKKMCPAGVYYYVCQVHEVHLSGIQTRVLKGYVHLISEDGTNTQPE